MYKKNMLLISLPTASPAALHSNLSQALISTLKHQMEGNGPITKLQREGNNYLLDLLLQLQPDEKQLERLYDIVDIEKAAV